MSTQQSWSMNASDPIAEIQRRVVELRRASQSASEATPNVWQPSADVGADEEANGPLTLNVRAARYRDLPGIARIRTVRRLNQPDLAIRGYSCARSIVRANAPLVPSKPHVFVATVESRIVGFVQFQPAGPDRRWHAIAVGTATGVYDSGPVEDELLRHAITAAGLRGVKRLFGRIPSGTDLLESFGRVGFSPYATETIFAADGPKSFGLDVPVRRQEPSDTWAIHQLHNATVPKQVQYAEAITSHRWDLRGRDELSRSDARLGWLVDDGAGLGAYGRVSCGHHVHVIELLYLPDRTEVLGGLIDRVVADLRASDGKARVYCTLRGYQAEAAKELEARGFEPVLEQDLLVKYTTATARAPQFEPLPLHSEVIERLPKRVPSFLQQKPHDEKAG